MHSFKADGDFDEQTLIDDLSERQNVSIMNVHSITLMDLYEMLPNMLTTYLAVFFFFNPSQNKESEANVLPLGSPGHEI